VGCRPTDPRRHPRGVGGTDHGNRALTGGYGPILLRTPPPSSTKDGAPLIALPAESTLRRPSGATSMKQASRPIKRVRASALCVAWKVLPRRSFESLGRTQSTHRLTLSLDATMAQ